MKPDPAWTMPNTSGSPVAGAADAAAEAAVVASAGAEDSALSDEDDTHPARTSELAPNTVATAMRRSLMPPPE